MYVHPTNVAQRAIRAALDLRGIVDRARLENHLASLAKIRLHAFLGGRSIEPGPWHGECHCRSPLRNGRPRCSDANSEIENRRLLDGASTGATRVVEHAVRRSACLRI